MTVNSAAFATSLSNEAMVVAVFAVMDVVVGAVAPPVASAATHALDAET